ncbi:MAG: PilZ domain-containing protein [Granulosicoccus sp.]|nr:PilZ domain-containing protein [Granulosicoccus sp.]
MTMASDTLIELPHGERRSFERVQDAVALQVRKLTDEPAAGEPKPKDNGSGSQRKAVRKANKYDIEGYAEVKRQYPQVATYIDELEERIRQLLLGGGSIAETPSHKVSLSAGGLAFADDILLHPGQLVSVALCLFPSMTKIGCDARVISANDAPEIANGDKPTYRITFVRMTDEDRNAVVSHVSQLLQGRPHVDD